MYAVLVFMGVQSSVSGIHGSHATHGPFPSIKKAFAFIKQTYKLKSDLVIASQNYDYELEDTNTPISYDAHRARIVPMESPTGDDYLKRLDAIVDLVTGLHSVSAEILTHGRVVATSESQMFSGEDVARMLESVTLKTEALRLVLTKQFEQLKQEIAE